jgi:serine/threonine protein kinase
MDYLVRKSTVSEKMIVDLMFHLLDALAYLHSHTILHLDVRVSR